ncbi:relaxase/mobilization nuclease domain-containing protein [Segetibacter aerophilus]|uniref:MobA/VirD2-like nuclease domain-containing protein n=1 Tax=Segetibacter aerophilus TaxID=670293 RepID=A0A512BII0_9BACT|nr:relaxase/mobilization nuclease domain-containing protein [Segetibacter aerophilus]GEO11782.1 hypothetical protein SAE01_42780 [Segetibacter aerophilus]
MIGKITIGKFFRGCIAYCLHDKIQQKDQQVMKDRAEILMFNKCFGNEKELVQQFNEVRQLNMKLSKPVLHVTLSFAAGENLSKDKLMEMSEHCAKDLGFENNQYIAIAHRDTNHQHLHIVANRIGFDQRTVSDSNNYQKMAKYCRKMELRYELKQVLSPRKYLSKEQRSISRFDQRKELLRSNIQQALKECKDLHQFEAAMNKRGYKIIKGRGISFTDEKKVTVKGSELNYSLATIEKILARQQVLRAQGQSNLPAQPFVQQPASSNDSIFKSNEEGTMDVLMKPQPNNEEIDKHFKQKRKKKRQSHRL